MSDGQVPSLSLVLPVSASSRQTENALASLSAPYQELHRSLEILVVETPSDDVLGEDRARAFGDSVRYFFVDAPDHARTRALAIGIERSRGRFLGVFMDGAHLVTPRTVDTAERALALSDRALVALPDYRFDEQRVPAAGSADGELAWLSEFDWKRNPYAFFSKARFGPATANGFLGPLLGAACLFAPRDHFLELPELDPAIDRPGAAALRLWIYTELARRPATRLVVLAGEGAFRQHHAEIDDPAVKREEESVQSLVLSAALALPGFRAVHREPVVFGPIPGPAQRFVVESAKVAAYHCAACAARGEPAWHEDAGASRA